MTIDNPWAWQDGLNPYRSTPFQILDLDPTLAGRGAIRAHAQRRRRRIERAADRYPLFGRTLTVADINRAEEQLADVEGRLLAELLTHRPERTGDELTAELLDAFPRLPPPPAPNPRFDVDERIARDLLPDLSAAAPPPRWKGLLP
jgi:hypothetical protein